MALSRRYARRLALGLSLLATSALPSCAEEEQARTEIMVVIDSDLSVPDELDGLRIEVSGPGSKRVSASAVLGAGQPALPRSLGLVYEAGPRGPLLVEVQGRLGEQPVISRKAQLSFVAGRTLVLPMHLVHSCITTSCSDDQTCTEQGCRSAQIDAAKLADWDGDKPSLRASNMDAGVPADDAGPTDDAEPSLDAQAGDASAQDAASEDTGSAQDSAAEAGPDTGMCSPQPEQCNQLDDDCDGKIDNGYDLMTNPNHCGSCNMRCSPRDVCCRGSCLRTCQ